VYDGSRHPTEHGSDDVQELCTAREKGQFDVGGLVVGPVFRRVELFDSIVEQFRRVPRGSVPGQIDLVRTGILF
jgi:hypothetical protein